MKGPSRTRFSHSILNSPRLNHYSKIRRIRPSLMDLECRWHLNHRQYFPSLMNHQIRRENSLPYFDEFGYASVNVSMCCVVLQSAESETRAKTLK